MTQNKEAADMNADQINALFDAVEFQLDPKNVGRYKERWIFERVLGESPETIHLVFTFIDNVTTCPLEVIVWCQRQLAPKTTAPSA